MPKTFTKLSRQALRKLTPGQSLTEHGITFQRLADGDGVFTVALMVNGQRIHRVIGRESDGTTRTQAEEFMAQARSDAKHDRLALPKGRKLALSFRDAAAKYLQRLKEIGANDVAKKEMRLRVHLIPFFGDMPLSKISTFDVERYKRQRLQEKVIVRPRGKTIARAPDKDKPPVPGTVNRELAVLSHLFNRAIEWEWIDRRPAKIKLFAEGKGRITYLTAEQAAQLVEAAKGDNNAQVYPFIVIGLETSMRRMEILSIRREHVNLAQRAIYIPQAKAGAREQPITAHLAEFLEAHIAALPPGTPWLFPAPSARSGHTMDIRTPFRRVVVAAGLDPDVVLRHTLRHTAITHLVQAGVDLPTVKRISGHKTLAMVERYAHQNGAHIATAMSRLEAAYRPATPEIKVIPIRKAE
ncbi:MAG: tyrosine-type recombinase/integrase [Nevskia sp.]|nr:tyrosine-type recombinase/integrase [Nevskia sp.]